MNKGICVKEMNITEVGDCVQVYKNAYAEAPWKESYQQEDVEKYIMEYIESQVYRAFVIKTSEETVGMAMGAQIPFPGKDFFRVEDFCIEPRFQGKGYGRALLEGVENAIKKQGIDEIIISTQKDTSAYLFYRNMGYSQINSAVFYKRF